MPRAYEEFRQWMNDSDMTSCDALPYHDSRVSQALSIFLLLMFPLKNIDDPPKLQHMDRLPLDDEFQTLHDAVLSMFPFPLRQRVFPSIRCFISKDKRVLRNCDVVTHIRFPRPTTAPVQFHIVCSCDDCVTFSKMEIIPSGSTLYRLRHPMPLLLWYTYYTHIHGLPSDATLYGVYFPCAIRNYWHEQERREPFMFRKAPLFSIICDCNRAERYAALFALLPMPTYLDLRLIYVVSNT